MGFGKVGGMDLEVTHIIVEVLFKDVLLTSCRFHILMVNWVISWIYLGECVTSVYCMQNCHYYLVFFFLAEYVVYFVVAYMHFLAVAVFLSSRTKLFIVGLFSDDMSNTKNMPKSVCAYRSVIGNVQVKTAVIPIFHTRL